MDTLVTDIRFGLRSARRQPLSALLAVTTLALGISVSTAMVSVVDAVLLTSLPYPEADRIVSVYVANPSMRGHPTLGALAERGVLSFPEIEDLRRVSEGVLDGLAVLAHADAILSTDDGPAERASMALTRASLFQTVLPTTPGLGRVFGPDDERRRSRAVLLSDRFWRRRFGADPAVVRSVIDLRGPREVIGVLPASFELAGWDVDAWGLMTDNPNRVDHGYEAIGRLSARADSESASRALTVAFHEAAPPGEGHDHSVKVFGRHDEEVRELWGPLGLLTFAAGVLLAVACGNVAVLLLGAALDREAELVVRGALGASRSRLARQLLTGSAVLATGAGALGVALAGVVLDALVRLAPEDVPRLGVASVDGTALGIAVLLAAACALASGLVPALVFSRPGRCRS